jgi:hypothetical protein
MQKAEFDRRSLRAKNRRPGNGTRARRCCADRRARKKSSTAKPIVNFRHSYALLLKACGVRAVAAFWLIKEQ